MSKLPMMTPSNHKITQQLDLELEEDAARAAAPPADQLTSIVAAAQDLREWKQNLTRALMAVDEAKARVFTLETEILPALMDAAGVKELALTEEDRIIRDEEVFASIAKANMPKAIKWLDAHHYGAIVKSQFIIPLDRSDPKRLETIRKLLVSKHVEFEESGSIHAQTLRAFARESIEEGRHLCKEIAVHVQNVVKLKATKPSKRSN